MLKSILLSISLISMSALAIDPPVSLKGQDATIKLSPKWNLQVPNNQATNLGGIDALIETGNQNILRDPSLEGSNLTSAWSLSGASFVIGNTPIHGKLNGRITATASSFILSQSSTSYAAQFADGVQGIGTIMVRTSVSTTPLYVCPIQAGALLALNYCATIVANGKWGLYKVPFVLGGTSNGISITSNGVAITGNVDWDNAFVGQVDLKQDVNNVGNWVSYTPTGSWTTNTAYSGKWRQVGDNLEVQARVSTSGAPNSIALTVNLPGNFVIDVNKILAFSVDGLFGFGSTNDSNSVFYDTASAFGSTTSIQVLVKSAAGAYVLTSSNVTPTVPFTFGAGDFVTVNFIVPVVQFSGSNSIYTSSNQDTGWSSCGHTAGDFIGLGTVTNIETQCLRDGSDLLMRGRFTTGTATATEARVGLKLSGSSITSASSPSISAIQRVGDVAFSTTGTAQYITLIEPSVTYLTFGMQATASPGLTKLTGAALGSASVVSIDARIPISGWDNSNVIIGSFNEVTTTPGITLPVEFAFSYGNTATTACNANPCAYFDAIGTGVSGVNFTSTGLYSIVFPKIYNKVKCTANVTGTAASEAVSNLSCASCSSLSFTTHGVVVGAVANTYGTLRCLAY